MNDLISRSKVLDLLYKIFEEYNMTTDKTSDLKSFGTDVFKAIKDMPTDYDVCKVVEELEKIKGLACDGKSCSECEYTSDCFNGEQSEKVAIDKAIEIVNQGGVSDDVCEWKMDNVGASIGCRSDLHHTGYVNRTYCPYCRKKIKVVE